MIYLRSPPGGSARPSAQCGTAAPRAPPPRIRETRHSAATVRQLVPFASWVGAGEIDRHCASRKKRRRHVRWRVDRIAAGLNGPWKPTGKLKLRIANHRERPHRASARRVVAWRGRLSVAVCHRVSPERNTPGNFESLARLRRGRRLEWGMRPKRRFVNP